MVVEQQVLLVNSHLKRQEIKQENCIRHTLLQLHVKLYACISLLHWCGTEADSVLEMSEQLSSAHPRFSLS